MTAIIVLGLHCGGTSAVAGVLHHLGVHMGDDLIGPSYNNPRGHFEDREFVELHDRIIGDWKNPTKQLWDSMDNRKYKDLIERRILLHSYPEDTIWGVKDPRMVWTAIKFIYWCSHIQQAPVVVINVERRPGAAAQSLFFRGGHTPMEARDISLRYYAEKAKVLEYGFGPGTPRERWRAHHHTVPYDSLIDEPLKWVIEILSWITQGYHLTGWHYEYADKIQAAIEFIDPSLRHWR